MNLSTEGALALQICVALGVGLLVGAEREQSNSRGTEEYAAGIRTFSAASLLGAVAGLLDSAWLTGVVVLVVGAMALMSYWRKSSKEHGLTTEVALVLVCLLGALALKNTALAAGLGVILAGLLASRDAIHRFVKKTVTQQELHDLILLAATALIVLPLLPDQGYGPFNTINPHRIAQFVLMIMSLAALGHVARRAIGQKRGLAVAGFAGGFVSSTATLLNMARLATARPDLRHEAVIAGMLSNVATIVQFYLLVSVLMPDVMVALWMPLACGGAVAVAYSGFLFVRQNKSTIKSPPEAEADSGRSIFDLQSTAILAGAITLLTVAVAALKHWLGDTGVLLGASISGFADAQAVVPSLASVRQQSALPDQTIVWAILLSFSTNTVSKAAVCIGAGSKEFAKLQVTGIVLLMLAVWAGAAWV